MPTGADEAVALRPSLARYFGDVKRRAPLLLPYVLVAVARPLFDAGSTGEFLLTLGVLLVATAVVVGLTLLHVATSSVRLTSEGLEHRGALVRDRTLARGDLEGLLAPLSQPVAPASEIVVLRSPGDGATVRLSAGVWSGEQLKAIARHMGVPVSRKPLSGRDIERLVPGSMPWRMRRPLVFSVIVAVLIVGGAVAGTAGWWMVKDRPPFARQPPREVSAATIDFQDRVFDEIALALPGRWQPPRVRFYACERDGHKGWTRWVDRKQLKADPVGREQIETAADSLVDLGFYRPRIDDEHRYLSAITEGPIDESPTAVELFTNGAGRSSLQVRGPCEVP